MGWFEMNLMVVLVMVGLRNMSISRLYDSRIMRSRKLIHPLFSCVGLSFMFVCICFMFVCIWFMHLLMVLGLVHLVSCMIRMSSMYLVQNIMFFVSRSCFICASSRCCRNILATTIEIGDPMDTPLFGW